MTEPISFSGLLAALRDSLMGAREATRRKSARGSTPRIAELTLSFEGTLYESANGLGLRLGRRRSVRRRPLQHLQIRMHGYEPIITEVSINGHSVNGAAAVVAALAGERV